MVNNVFRSLFLHLVLAKRPRSDCPYFYFLLFFPPFSLSLPERIYIYILKYPERILNFSLPTFSAVWFCFMFIPQLLLCQAPAWVCCVPSQRLTAPLRSCSKYTHPLCLLSPRPLRCSGGNGFLRLLVPGYCTILRGFPKLARIFVKGSFIILSLLTQFDITISSLLAP